MVQPAAPDSYHSCITTPIVNSYPCQLISGIAQKIADFVTGIFTTIANFVRYCLCMSSPAAAPAPVNPAPAAAANSAPIAATTPASTPALPATTTPAPAPAAQGTTSTSSAPAATTSAPAINPAVVEAGKRFLLSRVAVIDQANPNNHFRARLNTEENGRRAFATALIHAAIALPPTGMQTLDAFVNGCAVEPNYHPIEDLRRIKANFGQLAQPSQADALKRFTGAQGSPQQPAPEVAAFLLDAYTILIRLTQDPIFNAAAEAARMELDADVL